MTPILLTGSNGQVGRALAGLAWNAPLEITDRTRLDLADPDQIVAAVRATRPGIILNAAAYTAVDQAESDPALALAINAKAPGILAEEARRIGALLVHYSTDYVFDGQKSSPYLETDSTAPLNVYGLSKRAGEEAIDAVGGRFLILRTSWVYDRQGRNFLQTIRRLGAERPALRIVDDQIGAPTWSQAIADTTKALVLHREPAEGLLHLTAPDATSWFGFATAIVRKLGLPAVVEPISTQEYPLPARRPANSRLDCHRLAQTFGVTLPPWEAQLDACLAGLPAA